MSTSNTSGHLYEPRNSNLGGSRRRDTKNRITAGKIIQRQFKELMSQSGLEVDSATGMKHSIYSLRHTAICMRLVLSEGKVNIFNLAKNAGTSVEQIERFYARNLPMSAEMARNLQSFGG